MWKGIMYSIYRWLLLCCRHNGYYFNLNIMRRFLLCIFLLCLCWAFGSANAQITSSQLKPFLVDGYELSDTSGPGLHGATGDILLNLVSQDPDDYELLIVLHKDRGRLTKIAENASLVLGRGMVGNSGASSASLSAGVIYIDCNIGSNSGYTRTSTHFEKEADGKYYFSEYRAVTHNYGVENLFARERKVATPDKKVSFQQAINDTIYYLYTPGAIRESLNGQDYLKRESERVLRDKEEKMVHKYVPEGMQLATYAIGDLNLDSYKSDLVLIAYDETEISILLLNQQKEGRYKTLFINNKLLFKDAGFNAHNFKVVIKNGYFTIEKGVAVDNKAYLHQYITFNYNREANDFLLHRFDVESYYGFNPKPAKTFMELTKKDFGQKLFQEMNSLPGIYGYGAPIGRDKGYTGYVTSGILMLKPFSDHGGTVMGYVLKPDYPICVMDPNASKGGQGASVVDIRAFALYRPDQKFKLENWVNKHIRLEGEFKQGLTGKNATVIFVVKKVIGN